MSRENVELVLASLEGFIATGTPPSRFFRPDYVWDMSTFRGWPEEAEYYGEAGYMEFLRKWQEPYEEWEMTVERVVDAGSDRVVAVLRQRGRPKRADSWLELRYGIVYILASGLIERMRVFGTVEEALEAVGLRG